MEEYAKHRRCILNKVGWLMDLESTTMVINDHQHKSNEIQCTVFWVLHHVKR